jgi:hypothetical protein
MTKAHETMHQINRHGRLGKVGTVAKMVRLDFRRLNMLNFFTILFDVTNCSKSCVGGETMFPLKVSGCRIFPFTSTQNCFEIIFHFPYLCQMKFLMLSIEVHS